MTLYFIIFIAIFLLIVQYIITKREHKKAIAEAYKDAGYIAEMWIIDKYGSLHECDKITATPCHEIGELADKLREIAYKERKK